MPWIRSPVWDGFWILSGLPLGLALTILDRFGPGMPLRAMVALFLANGHALAPIVAGWGNAGFRVRVMSARPWKYIALPGALLLGATAIGIGTSVLMPSYQPGFMPDAQINGIEHDYRNPFVLLLSVYLVWNAYHFGMQNFGVLSLYRRGLPCYSRRIDKAYACALTWAAMSIPLLPAVAHSLHNATGWPRQPYPFLSYAQDGYLAVALVLAAAMLARELLIGTLPRILFVATLGLAPIAAFWAGLWVFAIILVNHWLVAIGLASTVQARGDGRVFVYSAIGLIFVGAVLFAAIFLGPDLTMHLTAWAIGFRIGLGFVHFLYDRWIYRSPEIKFAVIGRTEWPSHPP